VIYQEMGFPQSQSELAIQAFGTVQAALEALLAGKGKIQNAKTGNTYNNNRSTT